MATEWKIKRFQALSLEELYQILKLRSEVFVVEQNCVYLDIDDKDQKALHVFGQIDEKMVAYARLFNRNDYFENASIGRVVTHPDFRANKIGHQLMKQAIEAIDNHFGEKQITISAQLYLKKFYESHGFEQTSEMYLEDDIPHIEMKRN
ncbi:MAG TPA: GNAT family N-acetyltransferase [Flavobacterium sp.]|jgi:ElaA protein|uniref:GNAT family N-acetyltransferase n=1 Tax=Flavobacterium sp. TaxID=239 RepID=UPI002B8522A3|nr:GNAT family N-acetyltransferase [Flavobacterium sp.]HPW97154.1 GNAT family N-acetyltransferase [Flavobacterium sp.]HQA73443.1 GNAT family N-acetyltransferase [Flavobacterium sp.]